MQTWREGMASNCPRDEDEAQRVAVCMDALRGFRGFGAFVHHAGRPLAIGARTLWHVRLPVLQLLYGGTLRCAVTDRGGRAEVALVSAETVTALARDMIYSDCRKVPALLAWYHVALLDADQKTVIFAEVPCRGPLGVGRGVLLDGECTAMGRRMAGIIRSHLRHADERWQQLAAQAAGMLCGQDMAGVRESMQIIRPDIILGCGTA